MVVHTVQKIEMNTSSTPFLVPGERYVFPITMYGADGAELTSFTTPSWIQQNIRLDCRYNLNAGKTTSSSSSSSSTPLHSSSGGSSTSNVLDENSVDVTSMYDAALGKHACVVKIMDTSIKFVSKEHEFPMAKYVSLVATASDAFGNSRSTYTYRETLPNLIPFIPNMRIRVRYPHDLPATSTTSSTTASTTAAIQRGKLLLGCVELQPRTPFAFLEVFVRTDVADIPLEYSGPPEVTIERMAHTHDVIMGWTKFTYKIAARNREVPFKESEVRFTHPQSGQSQEECVAYGQKHEHQWYCAVKSHGADSSTSSTSKSTADTTEYTRNYCQQCPSTAGHTAGQYSDGRGEDTRERLLRCCVPNSGELCESAEVTESFNCKGSPKPPTDCGDFNLGASGTSTRGKRGKDNQPQDWEDVPDSQLSTYIMAIVCVIVAGIWKSGSLWRCVNDTLRAWCCAQQRRDPRQNGVTFGGLNPVVPGGRRDGSIHQRNPTQIRSHNRARVPRPQPNYGNSNEDDLLTW